MNRSIMSFEESRKWAQQGWNIFWVADGQFEVMCIDNPEWWSQEQGHPVARLNDDTEAIPLALKEGFILNGFTVVGRWVPAARN